MLTVSELAKRSGSPVSTIKFYLRERLLPQGNLDAPHRAFYDDAHVRRLQLIRALRDVAGLPISRVRSLCRLLDRDASKDEANVIAHVIDAIARPAPPRAVTRSELRAAKHEVLEMLTAKGVQARKTARSVGELAAALVHLRKLFGPSVTPAAFVPYLDAMCALAARDFEMNRHLVVDRASAAVGATYATIVWEPILVVLRRIAHEHTANVTFGGAS